MAACREVQKELDVIFGSELLDRLDLLVDCDAADSPGRDEIAAGGMGVVYEAWQRSTERRVALKVIAAHLLGNPRALERFEQEVKGPISYLRTRKLEKDISLLAMEERKCGDDKPGIRFPGIVFVHGDSPIKKPEDIRQYIKGKKVAFGDPDSTICTYLFQEWLVQNGIKQEDLDFDPTRDYLGSHEQVADAVLEDRYAIGCIKYWTFWQYVEKKKDLREIARVYNVTKPWIARKCLEAAISDQLRNGLLAITKTDYPAALRALSSKCTGFCEAKPENYQDIAKRLENPPPFSRPDQVAQD